ncbi:isoprenylcysteine carboxylmethyltransferase family protein [Phaeobacter sp. J2-8]|uniref:methyltransferase family protein n=1 Tax=Phaeobacter sp. J2-8 TaxID=2931394 RepID=UPI001FD02FEE|nr:isoprenylcysteine carboxylmethyltransferase family protein [Phaeobacter sp. J2-8]MCJ7872856.1 isoprenylcysteine carboxylmethyltransferase family protein [Phaeobacter sp. J2-8]
MTSLRQSSPSSDPRPAAAHSHPWKISDVVIFPMIALGLILEWLCPTSFGLGRAWAAVIGLAGAFAGFQLVQWSKRTLDAASQPSLPGAPTTALVTRGPFRFSRNPNYLGAVVMVTGGALALDTLWVLAAVVPVGVILDVWMIRPEEAYLQERFGDAYSAYRRRTRRWI